MNNVKSITPNTPADFTPTMGNYKDLQPFRYWCHKILPMVYDDSLSYYELLCKVVDYLNKTMEDVETLHGDVTNIRTAYEKLQGYVNEYFSTLDVQEEINNKLDNMASSGELYEIIRSYTDPIVNEQNDKINVLKVRMDTFASLPEGSTSGDAELLDIRVKADGTTATSAGNAVREQVSELRDDLTNYVLCGIVERQIEFLDNKSFGGNVEATNKYSGKLSDSNGMVCAEIPVSVGDTFIITGFGGDSARLYRLTTKKIYDGGLSSKILEVSEPNLQASNMKIDVYEDGFLYVNFNKTYPYSIVKGESVKSYIDSSLSFLSKARIKDFIIDKSIGRTYNVGDKISLQAVDTDGFRTYIAPVVKGETFTITGLGGDSARLYYFTTTIIDGSARILEVAEPNKKATNLSIAATQNGYIIVNVNAYHPYSLYKNNNAVIPYATPEDYGAVGDGITDDTLAVQMAINNADVVNLSASYCVHSLVINKNITIKGGRLVSTKTETGGSGNLITCITHNVNIVFDSVDFDGNCNSPIQQTQAIENLIKIWNASNVSFLNCKIHNHANGELGEEHISVSERKSHAVCLFNTNNILFEGCEFYRNFEEQISIGGYKPNDNYEEFVTLTVTNCYSHDNTESAALFILANLKSGLFANNTFTNNKTSFVNLLTSNVVFDGNIFDTTGKRAVATEKGLFVRMENIIVKNNIFKNISDRAIEIGAKNCMIVNNIIYNAKGIMCAGANESSDVINGTAVKELCPYTERCNTLDDEGFIVVKDNKIEKCSGDFAIRIASSYGKNDEITNIKKVNLSGNVITNEAAFEYGAIGILQGHYTDVDINDNTIECNESSESRRGFVTMFGNNTFKKINIKNNNFRVMSGALSRLIYAQNGNAITLMNVLDNIYNVEPSNIILYESGVASNITVEKNMLLP